MLSLNRFPEWTPDGAGVGPAIEDGPNDFDLASPGVAMFTDIAVKAYSPVVLSFPSKSPSRSRK
jgi:hypothetical protein